MTLDQIFKMTIHLNNMEFFNKNKMEINVKMSKKEADELEYQLELKSKGAIDKNKFKPTNGSEYDILINGITFNIIKN
jgi:hypothetical protein